MHQPTQKHVVCPNIWLQMYNYWHVYTEGNGLAQILTYRSMTNCEKRHRSLAIQRRRHTPHLDVEPQPRSVTLSQAVVTSYEANRLFSAMSNKHEMLHDETRHMSDRSCHHQSKYYLGVHANLHDLSLCTKALRFYSIIYGKHWWVNVDIWKNYPIKILFTVNVWIFDFEWKTFVIYFYPLLIK